MEDSREHWKEQEQDTHFVKCASSVDVKILEAVMCMVDDNNNKMLTLVD